MPKLVTDAGHGITREFRLPPGVTTVGRSAANGIAVSDVTLSRNHARIAVGPEFTEIEDTGSSSGTFVNDRRIVRCRLSVGDRIRCGGVVFDFVPDDGSNATPPRPSV